MIEGGDLDLDCHIRNPSARPIKTFTRQSEGYHTFVADDPGDYAVCLDNSYSSMVPKLVYLILETNAEDQLEVSCLFVLQCSSPEDLIGNGHFILSQRLENFNPF